MSRFGIKQIQKGLEPVYWWISVNSSPGLKKNVNYVARSKV